MQNDLITRRGLLKTSVAIGSCVIFGGAVAAVSATSANAADATVANTQYGFLVDLNKCVGCENCVAACRYFNKLSDDTPNRRHVETFENSKGVSVYASTSCMHCADPSCARVCPSGAITKGDAGIVSTANIDKCIGCKYCFQACPYGVPNFNFVSMDKCDCCVGAGIAPGDTPYCVQNCKFNALKYGPMDELREYARGTAVPIAAANTPSCLVVGEVS